MKIGMKGIWRSPKLRRWLTMGWSALLLSLAVIHVAQAGDFAKLDEAIPGVFVADLAPVFDFDTDGCLPSAGISRRGEQNGGQKATGSIGGACRSSNFLDTSNTIHRFACKTQGGSTYCGHFYALYFEKDQVTSAPIPKNGHRHDWEYAAIWTKDGVMTHGGISTHHNAETKAAADIPFENGHMKVVYHKDAGTHLLRFAKSNETAENPYGKFVSPTLVSWFSFTGDGLDNATMRAKLNSFNYGAANLPVNDNHFLGKLNAAKPSTYPEFPAESIHQFSEPLFLVAKQSGKCMDVFGGAQTNDAPIIQWECLGGANQSWNFVEASNGYYTLVAKHSNKCVDVPAASLDKGTRLIQWDCHGGNNQLIKREAVGSYYRLRVKHSGLCVTVDGASSASGAQIVQADCLDADNQLWSMTK